jgi:hypothetical protein
MCVCSFFKQKELEIRVLHNPVRLAKEERKFDFKTQNYRRRQKVAKRHEVLLHKGTKE